MDLKKLMPLALIGGGLGAAYWLSKRTTGIGLAGLGARTVTVTVKNTGNVSLPATIGVTMTDTISGSGCNLTASGFIDDIPQQTHTFAVGETKTFTFSFDDATYPGGTIYAIAKVWDGLYPSGPIPSGTTCLAGGSESGTVTERVSAEITSISISA